MSEKQIEGGKAAAAIWGAVSTTGPAVFGAAMMLIALYYRAVGRVISQIGSTVLADGIAIKI